MRVSVIGAGYVGLVSGVCLAEKGHQVACVDVDRAKVDRILRGEPPIHEAGLPELLRRNLGRRFTATTDLAAAVRGSELTLIAVGTPFDGARIDLSAVREAARAVGAALRGKTGWHGVIVKSTVVPGTTDGVVRALLEEASGKRVGDGLGLGMNPEFLTEGQAVQDFMEPDRIVLGAMDPATHEALASLYAPFGSAPLFHTSTRAAELIKYASNALLATMISFSNELADLCSAVGGVDVVDVMQGLHASAYLAAGGRTAPIASFLMAGCGYGGSCLPKDVAALVAHGEGLGCAMPLLRAVMTVNDGRARRVIGILEDHFPSLSGRKVAVLGLAFKPDTDDVRQSPAFPIVRALREAGASVKAYDPVAMPQARAALAAVEVEYADSLAACVDGADAVVLVTRWKEFEALPALLRTLGADPLVVDGRRQLARGSVARYAGIGLGEDHLPRSRPAAAHTGSAP